MFYLRPATDARVDQGDIFDDCPILEISSFDPDEIEPVELGYGLSRVVVLTQTCDLANEKTSRAIVARLLVARDLVDQRLLKESDVRGPIRSGRVFGLYYLPKDDALGLPEAVVDLRQVQSVRLDLLRAVYRKGSRRAQIQPLYREHLAKHFADTYSRIGLPEAYPTDA